jgi:CheY-like chemotaxis protein
MRVYVLVVEDDPPLQRTVSKLLQDEGYEVHCVDGPDEAIAALDRLPRPCILLWDALTPRHGLSMLDRAALDGVHIATLPVTLAFEKVAGSSGRKMVKRLTSDEAILSVVHEYCPAKEAAND